MDRLLLILLLHYVSWFYWPCSVQIVQAQAVKSDLSSVDKCTKTNVILTPLEMFYLSARYYSYCTEKFGNKTLINGTTEYSCGQAQCQSCLKACKTITAKTTSDCLSKCTGNYSVACQDGCKFYVGIAQQASQGNSSGSYPPSAAVTYPLVPSIGYKQMKLKWNTTVSASPVFYVIYAYPVSQAQTAPGQGQGQGQGPSGKRKKRMLSLTLIPINITIHAQKIITRSFICTKFPNPNHKVGTKFVYEIAGVTRSGWVMRTQQYVPAVHVSFTPADRVANLTTVGEPFLTKSVTLEYVINYKVQWKQKPGAQVSHYLVRYEETQCRHHGTIHPQTVSSGSNNGTIKIYPPALDTTPCDITLIVTSMLDCIVGQSTRLTVSYKGCQIFSNAPSQCNLTTTIPVTVSPIIAWNSSEQFICQSNVDSICYDGSKYATCKKCTSGYYNATMMWNKPIVAGNVLYYKCKLFRLHEKFQQYVPLGPAWDTYQTSTVLTNLQPNKAYQFKVFVFTSTNTGANPMWHSLQGFNFNTKAIPVPTTIAPPHTTLIPRTAIKFTTTEATTSTKPATTAKQGIQQHVTNNNQTVGLAAGLGTALFVVLIGGILFILFEKRRRRRKDNKKTFTTTEFSCAHYQPTPPVDDWEIPIENIVFGEAIGEGAFGKVYTATVKGVTLNYTPTRSASANSLSEVTFKSDNSRRSEITMKAAVKILQDGSGEQQRVEFLEEIKLMKEVGQHKNIVSLLACVTQSSPLCLVVEFMPFGDLLHYLRGRRSKILSHSPLYMNDQFYALKYISDGEINNTSTENLVPYINSDDHDENDARKDKPSENRLKVPIEIKGDNTSKKIKQNDDDDDITPEDLLRFSWQIASGMEYLAKQGFVHRDLAARNVLVGPNKSCKISDFGLTRLVYEEKVYMGKRSRRLPIKWMSIEAIVDQVFTTYSDVWSFGVLLFEIVTLGGTPYPTLTSQAMLRLLRTGHRMEKPETCSDELYNVMMACWLENPTNRPTFTDIKEKLEQLISEGTPYLEFDFDDSKPYYNVPSFRSIEDSEQDDSEDDEDEVGDTTMRFTSLDRRANVIENGCHVDVASKGTNDEKLNEPLDKEKEERYAWSTKLAKAQIDA